MFVLILASLNSAHCLYTSAGNFIQHWSIYTFYTKPISRRI